jgi:hypothetical protein
VAPANSKGLILGGDRLLHEGRPSARFRLNTGGRPRDTLGPDREFVIHSIGRQISRGPGDRVGGGGFGDLMQGDLILTVADLLDGVLDRVGAMPGHRAERGDDATASATPALSLAATPPPWTYRP